MKVLVTGSRGFIAKNLIVRLKEKKSVEVFEFHHDMSIEDLYGRLDVVDFVFHLAGVNRPKEEEEFEKGNAHFTALIANHLVKNGRDIPVVYSSSIQAEVNNPYGFSKRNAEESLLSSLPERVFIYRLPNVFGKWSRPNYNSVVATFCYNIVNGLPILINDPNASITLVYIDDVISAFISVLESCERKDRPKQSYQEVQPVYQVTVGALAEQIRAFKDSRQTLLTGDTGSGFVRALYATYLSFFKPSQFSYSLKKHEDPRGVFVEILKTKNAGQFSFFTAHPGVTRGGHYHHSKTEKFLVIKGKAKYRFKNIVTDETYELIVDSAKESTVVETVPGWSHDITNIGNDELVVMLWANELFDREKPDTIGHEVV